MGRASDPWHITYSLNHVSRVLQTTDATVAILAQGTFWAVVLAAGLFAKMEKLFTLLDLCVSSLRRGHANLLCVIPILTDDPRRESRIHILTFFLAGSYSRSCSPDPFE